MDIVRKIKPLKASFENLSIKYRLSLMVVLVSLVSLVVPHESYAKEQKPEPAVMIFATGDHVEFLANLNRIANQKYIEAQLQKEAEKKKLLAQKVADYLNQYNSPLADYAGILITLPTWKKIVALANAESSFCRRYPQSTANCWGVGGANLWDMGDNLGEGVVSMDHFLRNYPTRSKVKYDKMSFEHMNGFYKQPAADHWLFNNTSVYNDLTAIENSIQ